MPSCSIARFSAAVSLATLASNFEAAPDVLFIACASSPASVQNLSTVVLFHRHLPFWRRVRPTRTLTTASP